MTNVSPLLREPIQEMKPRESETHAQKATRELEKLFTRDQRNTNIGKPMTMLHRAWRVADGQTIPCQRVMGPDCRSLKHGDDAGYVKTDATPGMYVAMLSDKLTYGYADVELCQRHLVEVAYWLDSGFFAKLKSGEDARFWTGNREDDYIVFTLTKNSPALQHLQNGEFRTRELDGKRRRPKVGDVLCFQAESGTRGSGGDSRQILRFREVYSPEYANELLVERVLPKIG